MCQGRSEEHCLRRSPAWAGAHTNSIAASTVALVFLVIDWVDVAFVAKRFFHFNTIRLLWTCGDYHLTSTATVKAVKRCPYSYTVTKLPLSKSVLSNLKHETAEAWSSYHIPSVDILCLDKGIMNRPLSATDRLHCQRQEMEIWLFVDVGCRCCCGATNVLSDVKAHKRCLSSCRTDPG